MRRGRPLADQWQVEPRIPSDESRITIDDHTDDRFSVMDSYGMDRAVVIGWSVGVNIAF
jgi:hypothetical protein